MKKREKDAIKFHLLIIAVAAILATAFCFAYFPQWHFWDTPEKRGIDSCMQFQPYFNVSGDNGEPNPCYTKYWASYCKIRAPEDCPKSTGNIAYTNVTDKEVRK